MAQTVRLGEQNLGEIVLLFTRVRCGLDIRDTRQITLFGDDKSSHWKARLMLAKAKMPSPGLSVILLDRLSLTITREIKDELLLVTLFFGFFRLFTSLVCDGTSNEFPSPNAGVNPRVAEFGASLVDVPRPSSLLIPPSVEYLASPDWSCELAPPSDSVVADGPL